MADGKKDYDRKHQASFYNVNVLVLHKLYDLCVTHGYDFSKTTYPAARNSSRFSTKVSIWICWDVGVEILAFFGLNNCLGKVAQIVVTKRLSVLWWKYATGKYGSDVAPRMHDKVFAPKGGQRWNRLSSTWLWAKQFSDGSDEVLSSL